MAAAAPSPNTEGISASKKRALLISNSYNASSSYPKLSGTDQDLKQVKQLLDNFHFTEYIGPLQNAEVTRAAFLQKLDELREGCSSADAAVIYFSGHGVRHLSQDAKTGAWALREGLLLRDGEIYWDYELQQYLGSFPSRNLTVIIDACRSGGMTRLVEESTGTVRGVTIVESAAGFEQWMSPLTAADLAPIASPNDGNQDPATAQARGPSSWFTNDKNGEDGNYVFLTACWPTQVAVEQKIDGESRGCFTWALARELQAALDKGVLDSWDAIIGRVQANVSALTKGSQQPICQGVTRRYPFQTNATELLRETKVKNGKLLAGSAHGVGVGSKWETKQGSFVIKAVDLHESVPAINVPDDNAWCVECYFGEAKTPTVAIHSAKRHNDGSISDGIEMSIRQLKSCLKTSAHLRLLDEKDSTVPSYTVTVYRDTKEVFTEEKSRKSKLPQLSGILNDGSAYATAVQRAVWARTLADIHDGFPGFIAPLPKLEMTVKVYYREAFPAEAFNSGMSLVPNRTKMYDLSKPLEEEPLLLLEGDEMEVGISYQPAKPSANYVTIALISDDYTVEMVLPTLAQGDPYACQIGSGLDDETKVVEQYPEQSAAFSVAIPDGAELNPDRVAYGFVLKVMLSSTKPVMYDWLQQDAVGPLNNGLARGEVRAPGPLRVVERGAGPPFRTFKIPCLIAPGNPDSMEKFLHAMLANNPKDVPQTSLARLRELYETRMKFTNENQPRVIVDLFHWWMGYTHPERAVAKLTQYPDVSDEKDVTAGLDLVFVHGFFGAAKETWTNSQGIFWPETWLPKLLSAHKETTTRIFTLGHAGALGIASFDEIVASCEAQLVGPSSKVGMSQRKMVLIGHSLGGLVIKALWNASAHLRKHVCGMVFYGTPHRGSTWANVHNFCTWFDRRYTKTAADLFFDGHVLQTLQQAFAKSYDDHTPKPKLLSFIETKSVIPLSSSLVTTEESAKALGDFGKLSTYWKLEGEDHISMCKPVSEVHPAVYKLVDFLVPFL